MYRAAILILFASVIVSLATGCMSVHNRLKTASLTMSPLAPASASDVKAAIPPSSKNVQMKTPLRVGLIFLPLPSSGANTTDIPSQMKQDLLEKIRVAFKSVSFIDSIEVIPTTYLKEGAEFESLAAATQAFNLDAIALLTYDQEQFSDPTNWTALYATVIGAFLVPAEKNETHTLVDASVVSVNPRMLLLHAAGSDNAEGWRTPMHVTIGLRKESQKSFERATDRLIADLKTKLEKSQADIKEGRGLNGIPVAFVTEAGVVVGGAAGGQRGGSGDMGGFGVLSLLIGVGYALRRRIARR